MAQTNGAGHNQPPLTEDEFLAFLNRLEGAESDLGAAVEACKAPKKRVKEIRLEIGKRMPIVAFDRMREDLYKPGSQRQAEDEHYRRAMAWMGKPVGYQTTLDFPAREAGEAELHRIDAEGYAVGLNGVQADENPYTPGEARFAAWENGRNRGHGEFLAEQQRLAAELGDQPPKRGPGRPRKDGTPAQPRVH